jgi:hypothetical protein
MNNQTFTAPYPTIAEIDYRQNGLVLPKERKHLEILLRDVHQKGFLDIELLYHLKQKEALKGVEQEIADTINDDQMNELKECARTFQAAFKRALE